MGTDGGADINARHKHSADEVDHNQVEDHLVQEVDNYPKGFHYQESYMCKEEVSKASLRGDRGKLGLVGWIHLQFKVNLFKPIHSSRRSYYKKFHVDWRSE